MKKYLSFIAGGILLFVVAFNKQIFNSSATSLDDKSESNLETSKGVYLASEFVKFKKEKLNADFYAKHQFSDKVLFKAFVRYKERKDSSDLYGMDRK